MPGAFDGIDLSPNPIEQARRAMEGRYLDLTSSNPTLQGWLFPPEILQAATNAYFAERRYQPDPFGNPLARAAIVAYYAQRQPPLTLTPEQIVITASTSEAYGHLFTLLANPGDNLLAPNVSYPLFDFLAEMRGLELRYYELDEQRNWAINEQSLLDAADARTRGVLIVSPNNPTGAIYDQPLACLQQLGLPLIVDEVFAPFTYAKTSVPPVAALHADLPIFTLNGISKLFALPDLKLGWIALNELAHERYTFRLELINDTFLGANSLSQHLLATLFAEGMPFVEQMVGGVRKNLDLALERLKTCRNLRVQAPAGGYYLFPALLNQDDEETLVIRLIEAGVLVHPGYFYGEPQGCHLMISALTEPTTFEAGIDRLLAVLH